MIHDPALLEKLSAFETERFDGEVFRATRISLEPLTPSTSGGRWAPRGQIPVLYTSLLREGALAEISFHWSQLTPPPSKPALVHKLGVFTARKLRLLRGDLSELGVDAEQYRSVNYHRTQEIGAAVAFLEHDGLMVPSARWDCENLVLFAENHAVADRLEVLSSEAVEWQQWAQDNGFLEASSAERTSPTITPR